MSATKKAVSFFLVLIMIIAQMSFLCSAEGESVGADFTVDAKGAILMEATTGKVLFEQNADEALPPASVTKVMTLLLVMEAIDNGQIKLTDMVTASANATSMGGSQIYLKEGEQMTVEDMLKSVVIASANDAAVALAEHLCGSEDAFVKKMNEKANELEMKNTFFENTNGLDDTTERHLTSARDIAIMSAELIKHKKILEYSSIWMDTVRDGQFGLTNTNRLIRFYNGATGLKTGSTSKAKFCISATAERNGMSLVAVIMGSPTRDIRNAEATKLLDYGFANYGIYKDEAKELGEIKVLGGVKNAVKISHGEFSAILESAKISTVKTDVEYAESIAAPIEKGEKIGKIIYSADGEKIGEKDIVCDERIEKIGFFGVFAEILKYFCLVK